jgi:hypothetical protein
MSKFVLIAIVLLLNIEIQTLSALAESQWTIMVYLNGKNDLEEFAISNFEDMAKVGSTEDVNILVEMGRPRVNHTNKYGPWSGVLRYKVEKDMQPTKGKEVMDLVKEQLPTNMGDPVVLKDFIKWGMEKYPAKHYFVIIWNHGQGYRFQLFNNRQTTTKNALDQPNMSTGETISPLDIVGGYRAVSADEDNTTILYNSDIQAVLEEIFPNNGLDILGYDVCLMGMIETAHASRKSARYMVASEELEPGAGWNYGQFMKELTRNPHVDPIVVSKLVVNAYRAKYRDTNFTTLSAIDLTTIEAVTIKLSDLAVYIVSNFTRLLPDVIEARKKIRPYGEPDRRVPLVSIDLPLFLSLLHDKSRDIELRKRIEEIQASLKPLIVENYASKLRRGAYGSNGIAIYFPLTKAEMETDPYRDGYLPENSFKTVEFVAKTEWPKFLNQYLNAQ